MKEKIKWMGLIVAVLMLVTVISPVFADSETDPSVEPVLEEETSSFWEHPIVKLLASFFSSLFEPPAVEEPSEANGDGTEPPAPPEEPSEGNETEPVPVVVPEEVIAGLHEEQELGFGEITKLLQILAEAKDDCVFNDVNCDVTLDGLIDEYKAGAGMGELFQKYGKPELLGVGHVRKEANPKAKSNNGKANGKNK